MADETLDQLKQAWLESGAVEDEGNFLEECLEQGLLEREQIQLAAYLGHRAAALALGGGAPLPVEELSECVQELSQGSEEVAARAAVATARHFWPEFRAEPFLTNTIHLFQSQAIAPSSDSVLGPFFAGPEEEFALRLIQAAEARLLGERTFSDPATLIHGVTTFAQSLLPQRVSPEVLRALWAAVAALGLATGQQSGPVAWSQIVGRLDGVPEKDLLSSLSGELVPWALGYSDPLRERASA